MTGSDNAAGKKYGGRKQRRFGGKGRTNETKTREEESDHRGGEDLEEALYPEMDHPPTPILYDRQVGVLAPGEAGAVEQADCPRGKQEKI